MDRHQFLTGIIVIALALLFGTSFLFPNIRIGGVVKQDDGKIASPLLPSPSIDERPSVMMKEYKDEKGGFSLQYPDTLTMTSKAEVIQWKNDSVTIKLTTAKMGANKSLLSLVKADVEQLKEQLGSKLEVVGEVSNFETVSIKNGYWYETRQIGQDVRYYYLPLPKKTVLLIETHRDATNQDALNTIDDFVKSVSEVNKQEGVE